MAHKSKWKSIVQTRCMTDREQQIFEVLIEAAVQQLVARSLRELEGEDQILSLPGPTVGILHNVKTDR